VSFGAEGGGDVRGRNRIIVCIGRVLTSLAVVIYLNPFQVFAASVSQSWYIELITFTERSAAQGFIERLAQKKFSAELIPVDVAGAVHYRVQTQPFSSFESAERYKQRLAGGTNLHDNHLLIRGPTAPANKTWSIDLLRFSDQSDASAFVARLHHKGFEAVVIHLDVSGQVIYQTQIQSLPSLDQALAYREQLK